MRFLRFLFDYRVGSKEYRSLRADLYTKQARIGSVIGIIFSFLFLIMFLNSYILGAFFILLFIGLFIFAKQIATFWWGGDTLK